ncbi:RHS repeat-associated core domain-containing protein [Lentisphaerota bacterium WC36G]|nr:DUF4329 domain-containing protein [Lentisphaerae bacterium WC36]
MALEKDGVVFNYIADGNKNITQLINLTTGEIANKYDYSPFGQLAKTDENVENVFKFSSEYAEKETGLVYYNYRYYNPVNGKWLNRDPIEEYGAWNIYNFIYNDSINYIDILGLSFHGIIGSNSRNHKENYPHYYVPRKPKPKDPDYSDSEIDAARKRGKEMNPKSIKEDIEYCGYVCKKCVKGKYKYFTTVTKGDVQGCDPTNAPCPSGSKPTAIWHTHGSNDPNSKAKTDFDKAWGFRMKRNTPEENEEFSEDYDEDTEKNIGDKPYSRKNRMPNYLFTPQGNMKKFDPGSGSDDGSPVDDESVTDYGPIK